MTDEEQATLRIYSLMGVCLLHVQLAERIFIGTVTSVLEFPEFSARNLMEQNARNEVLCSASW